MQPETAKAIAQGELDPLTLEPYQGEDAIDVPRAIHLCEDVRAVPNEGSPGQSLPAKAPLKRKSTLRVQTNNLSKYFVPVSASAKKGFKPPRSASQAEDTTETIPAPQNQQELPSLNETAKRDSQDSLLLDTPSQAGSGQPLAAPVVEAEGTRFSTPVEEFSPPSPNAGSGRRATASFCEEVDFDQPAKRSRSNSFDDTLAGLEFFDDCNGAAEPDPLSSFPSFSPDWRSSSRRKMEDVDVVFGSDSEGTPPRRTDDLFFSPDQDFSSPIEPMRRMDFDTDDLASDDLVVETSVGVNEEEGMEEVKECSTLEPSTDDVIDHEEAQDSMEDGEPAVAAEEDDAANDPETAGSGDGQSSAFLQDPALHSFSTDVSHVKEYEKIGHRALNKFERALGAFRHKLTGERGDIGISRPTGSGRQSKLFKKLPDRSKQGKGSCGLASFDDFLHRPRVSQASDHILS